MDQNGFKHAVHDDRFEVRKLFIQKAKEALPFLTGTSYADVTARCLSGSFDDGVEPGIVDMAAQFRDQVSLPTRPIFIYAKLVILHILSELDYWPSEKIGYEFDRFGVRQP